MNSRLTTILESPKREREEIIEQMRLCGYGSPPFLQKNLKISFDEAKKICDYLIYPKQT